LPEQDQSTLLEIFQYPGFDEDRMTPLPFNVSLERQIMRRVLPKQYTLAQHVNNNSIKA
jgi:homoserine kinase